MRHYLSLSAAALLLAATSALGQSAPSEKPPSPSLLSADTVLEKILVSGEQPGPALWKVSKGDHVLWVLGTQSPMPKKMVWRSKQVEKIIAESQEILTGPSAQISTKQIGFFNALTLIPSAMESRKNPDGATLKQLLPADLYARWSVLRDKYIGDYQDEESDIERRRPMFAALELYDKAINKVGLTSTNPVRSTVDDLAKKYKVKMSNIEIEPKVGNVRAALKEFKTTRLPDVDCLAKTIERIETDLTLMRARANAWATGDINAIRTLPEADQRAACEAAVKEATFIKALGMQDITEQLDAAWFAAVDAALAKNKVTFTILPIRKIVSNDGYIAKLKAKGYAVQEPDAD